MKSVCVLLTACLTLCAGEVAIPSIGFSRTSDGNIVRISGISGAFVTAATPYSGVVAAGFSGKLGVMKLASSVRVVDAAGEPISDSDAPDGPALIGFNSPGDAAIVYYPSAHAWAVMQSGKWRSVPVNIEPAAVALADDEHALALVAGDRLSLVRIRLSDGAIESAEDFTLTPAGVGSALLFPDGGVLMHVKGALIYRRSGEERRTRVPLHATALSHLGDGWVQLRTASGGNLALRLGPEVRIFEIPAVTSTLEVSQ